MRISRDEALSAHDAAKKLLTCRQRQCWLFCPYVPGANYHSVHWLPDAKQSVQCDGKDCRICPRPVNRKVHVPALVYKKPYPADAAESLGFPQDIRFNVDWRAKIVELTGNCIKPFNCPSEPDQLAIAWRPGSHHKATLFFKWITGRLRDVPQILAELSVAKILPGVIGGRYVNDVYEVDLDIPDGSRIEHNSPSPTRKVDERLESFFQAMGGEKGGAR